MTKPIAGRQPKKAYVGLFSLLHACTHGFHGRRQGDSIIAVCFIDTNPADLKWPDLIEVPHVGEYVGGIDGHDVPPTPEELQLQERIEQVVLSMSIGVAIGDGKPVMCQPIPIPIAVPVHPAYDRPMKRTECMTRSVFWLPANASREARHEARFFLQKIWRQKYQCEIEIPVDPV